MLYMHNIYASIHLFILNSLATKQNHTDFLSQRVARFSSFFTAQRIGGSPGAMNIDPRRGAKKDYPYPSPDCYLYQGENHLKPDEQAM